MVNKVTICSLTVALQSLIFKQTVFKQTISFNSYSRHHPLLAVRRAVPRGSGRALLRRGVLRGRVGRLRHRARVEGGRGRGHVSEQGAGE